MTQDLFNQINNAVLDLQRSQYQTYARPLKKLSQLLQHPDLEKYNNALVNGVDLKTFLNNSEETGGAMVDSSQLAWTDNTEKNLGLTLLLIERLGKDPNYAAAFSHHYFYSGSKIIDGIHSLTSQLIVPFLRDYKDYIFANGTMQSTLKFELSRKIFIVHGHDEGARETVARFIERIELEPIILHEQANQGRTIIEKIDAHGDVGFAIILLTPDDEGCSKGGTPEPRARQNVLLELGYFMGRLGRDKVCALKRGELEIPSDFAGVVWEQMNDTGGWQLALARELKAAKYDIDLNKIMDN